MNEDEIKRLLDRLAEFNAQRDLLVLQQRELVDALYTPEIKARIAEIEAEFSLKAAAVNENIIALESEIRKGVIAHGASVKGKALHAVYSMGRYSYSDKPKDGYVLAQVYRKEGEPSVSIRTVKP